MFTEGLEIEHSVLVARLQRLPGWDTLEGDKRLELAIEDGVQLANIDNYVDILGENYRLRKLQDAIEEAYRDVNKSVGRVIGKNDLSTARISGNLLTKIRNIASEGIVRQGHTIGDIAGKNETRRLEIARLQQRYTGIPSGITDLDEMTLGFQAGVIIVGARPSMGKTSVAIDLLLAAESYNPKGFYRIESGDMSKEQITDRILSKKTNIPMTRLRAPMYLTSEQNNLLRLAKEELQDKNNIFIQDDIGDTDEIIMSWYRQADKTGLTMIMDDYIQLRARGELHKHGYNMQTAVGTITSKYKKSVLEIGVPLLLLSQVKREVDDREKDKRPRMGDLSDASSLEADANIILTLYRDYVYNRESANTTMEILVEKQKDGPVGGALVGYNPATSSIFDLVKSKQSTFLKEVGNEINQMIRS